MNKSEIDVYLSLSENNLNISAFKKSDNSIIYFDNENINIKFFDEHTNLEILKKSIEGKIKNIEKRINLFVTNIFLIVGTSESISIDISLKRKLDNKKIQEKDIKHLIQDAKLQILKAYPDKHIVHIIVKKYIINDLNYSFVPSNINCNTISLDIHFICFSKKLVKKIENFFANLQIYVDKIQCLYYVKNFADEKTINNICQIGYHLNNGLNKQEVVIIPKTIEKKGFFEKLFHFFQ